MIAAFSDIFRRIQNRCSITIRRLTTSRRCHRTCAVEDSADPEPEAISLTVSLRWGLNFVPSEASP
jgi:hypothetical protein